MGGFFKHIFLANKVKSVSYTSLGKKIPTINKIADQVGHGNKLKAKFNEAFLDFWEGEPGNFVFVDIETFPGFELDLAKFEGKAGDIRSANPKEEFNEEGMVKSKSSVFYPKRELVRFQ
jgi:hypothetical protein